MNFLSNPQFYYINLNSSTDRYNEMEKTFNKYKLNYLRIPAIDANIPGLLETVLNMPKETHQSRKELACLGSHLIAIKKAYDDNYDEVIIMEDNVVIDFFLNNLINFKNVIKDVPKDYEIIQLLTGNPVAVNIFTNIKNNKYHKWEPLFWGAKVYLINRKGMKKILQKLLRTKITLPDLYPRISYSNEILHTADFLLFDNCITYTLLCQFFNFYPTISTINQIFYNDIHKPAHSAININQIINSKKWQDL